MRTYNISKTRAGVPKVTLYEDGKVLLCRPATTPAQAANLGRVWADSDEPKRGVAVENVR